MEFPYFFPSFTMKEPLYTCLCFVAFWWRVLYNDPSNRQCLYKSKASLSSQVSLDAVCSRLMHSSYISMQCNGRSTAVSNISLSLTPVVTLVQHVWQCMEKSYFHPPPISSFLKTSVSICRYLKIYLKKKKKTQKKNIF